MTKIDIPKFSNPPGNADVEQLRLYVKQLANQTALLSKSLDFLVNDGNITANNILANSITANKLDVDKLSAISADIGEVTAGIIRGISIYGSLISTRETGYPRTEMSVTGDLLRAYYDSSNYVSVEASTSGSPAFVQVSPGNNTVLKTTSSDASYGTDNDLYITSNTGDITLDPSLGLVKVQSFDKIYGNFDGQSLGSVLSDLSDRITALGG